MTTGEKLEELKEVEELVKKVNTFFEQFENFNENDLEQIDNYAKKVLSVVERLSSPVQINGKLTADSYSSFFERAADAIVDYFERQKTLGINTAMASVENSTEVVSFFSNIEILFDEFIKEYSFDENLPLVCKMADSYNALTLKVKEEIQENLNVYSEFGADANEYLIQNAHLIFDHKEEICYFFNRLTDSYSKVIFFEILRMLTFHLSDGVAEGIFDKMNITGIDTTIFEFSENDIVVDTYSEEGKFLIRFVENFIKPQKLISYSPIKKFAEELSVNIFKYDFEDFAVLREYLPSSTNGKKTLFYVQDGAVKEFEVDAVALDDDLTEKPTFLRISQTPEEVILGAKKIITENKPKLSIDVWRNRDEIWKIPDLIDKIQPGYKYYLQYKGSSSIVPHSFYLLAVYEDYEISNY